MIIGVIGFCLLSIVVGKIFDISWIMACGVLKPKEAFEFYKNIDYVDLISIGVAKVEEAREDFTLLKEY